MNKKIGLGLGIASLIAVAGIGAVIFSGNIDPISCNKSECRIEVTVAKKQPTLRCSVSVNGLAKVTDTVDTIIWHIGSPQYMFRSPNGVKIKNDAGDFNLLSSASGQEFKLTFLGQGKRRTYDYELDIVSVGDGESCNLPSVGPQPTLPRIKNE